ncbi:bifunctional diguanylate cyclase/phosphodiesterase [Pseudomonas cremoricolorata]|uniref:Diguanylate phosphodiesterase n=1 Tax=Pseudomonas cremoricolorata TaxID=157783 RepID=A0A089WRP3_9PSED|nr:sensor domain-containing phosphodiesterase [Pseudomonas cremoricolorata]AIR91266.1 diguanylate phosphodiesterase [Pseudomonas cremoricolorata]
MNLSPVPHNERKRLAQVAQLCVFQHQEHAELRALVELAGACFNAPMCLVSIVSERHQWFMAKTGLAAHSTSRDVSFCAHTLLEARPLEVTDASLDPRFCDNPLVTGEPGIRYYCGAPLIIEDGLAIGSFCIIDTVARPAMVAEQLTMLDRFAQLAMHIITGIRQRNFLDHPTGLLNRIKLECDVKDHLARQEGVSLVAFDVIQAASLNDVVKALGYNFAHDLTLQVKDRLAQQIDADLELYRISPTRFGTLVPAEFDVQALCARMLSALQAPVTCHGIPVPLDVGIGISRIDQRDGDGTDLEWLRRAVGAADAARRQSRRCAGYQPEADAAQRRAFILLSSLSQALRSDDQLSLHLQPRVDIASSVCASAEALLRWRHPTLGDISPAEFIPLAEKTALMPLISDWVMHAVFDVLARTRGLDFSVSMNVTASDLESPVFMDRLLAGLAERNLCSSRMQLEFTESMLVERLDVVQQQLQRARDAAIEIAIDDFGTGYSNWIYLSRIPATVVKLDRMLVQKSRDSARERTLVQTVIDLAIKLGYQVTAEGVETPEQLDHVQALGCAEAQGFLIARPMSLAAFEAWFIQYGTTHAVA